MPEVKELQTCIAEQAEHIAQRTNDSNLPSSAGSLMIITDDPPVGTNTQIMLNLVHLLAVRQHVPVAYYTCGAWTNTELVTQLISIASGIDIDRVKAGTLTAEEWNAFDEMMPKLSGAPLYIDDASIGNVQAFMRSASKLVATKGVRYIIIDAIAELSDNSRSILQAFAEGINLQIIVVII